MARRAAGEGTITKHKSGLWQGKVSLGHSATGKRIRRSVYGKTQAEVRRKIEELKRMMPSGEVDVRVSVGDYLTKWIAETITLRTTPKTQIFYKHVIEKHVIPLLGKKKLVRLTVQDCRKWSLQLRNATIGTSIRMKAHTVFSIALEDAVRDNLLRENPLRKIAKPRHKKREVQILSIAQCAALIEAGKTHRLGDLFVVALFTGLRIGELFGLHWSDVDFENRLLHVRRSASDVGGHVVVGDTKSATSRRTIHLEENAIRAFEERRRKAVEEGFGPDVCEVVFPNRKATYSILSNFHRFAWKPVRTAADLPATFRIHDLRHTHATLFLQCSGQQWNELQRRLGHANLSITMQYTHILEQNRRGSVDTLSRLGLSYDSENGITPAQEASSQQE